MPFYVLIFVILSCDFNVPVGSVSSYKQTLHEAGDLMVEHLIDKYKNTDHVKFFHPHVSESIKDGNREVVKISSVDKFSIHGHYKQWKHTRLGLNNYLLGLANSTLEIYSAADMDLIHSIRSNEKLVAFTAFTKWDEENYRSEMIIGIATSKPGIVVYRTTKDEMKQIGYWPLNYQVKAVEPCQALVHSRLLLIPASSSMPVELYSLDTSIHKSNFWFSQRLDVHGELSAACFDVVPMQSLIAVSQHSYRLIKVYSFDSSTGLYVIYQNIKVESSCVHLIVFSLSYQNFLACIPDPEHHIQFFRHSGGTYSRVNSLGNHSAVVAYAASIENYRDETILFIQDAKGDTHILSYDGIQNLFRSGYDCKSALKCLPIVDLSKGSSYQRHDGTAIYVSPSEKSNGNSTILVVHTKIEYGTHSPVYRQSRLLYDQFEKVQEGFEMWRAATTNAVNALENALDLSGDNTVTGYWKLTKNLSGEHIILKDQHNYNNNETMSGVTTSLKKFIFVDQNWEDKDFEATKEFDKIHSQLTYLKEHLEDVEHVMSDALLKNSSEIQIVKSPTIVRSHFTSSQFHGNNIWVDGLWKEENTTQFLSSLYLADFPTSQQIKGTVLFEKPLSMNSMNVEYYNGVRPENVARLSADNVFKSPVEFQHKFTATGHIHAPTVGGHDLAKELIMINDVRDCEFEDGLVTRETKIDDLYFNFDNILLKSTDQEIKSHISFEEVRAKNNAHVEKIHGHAFKPFVDNVVLQDYGGMINGSVQILGTLNCSTISSINTLNSVAFPHGYVKNNQPVVHMTGMQNFSHINADKVYIDDGILNGINIDKMWVGLSTPAKINATWVFSDTVTILRNMNVSEKVNGIDLDVLKFNQFVDERKDGYVINSDVEFTKPVVFSNLHVKSKINEKTHEEMFDGVLIFDGKECHVPHETELANSVHLKDLDVSTGKINMQLLNSLVTLNTAQNISGHMTLTNESFFHELHTEAMDSIPLSSFYDRTVRISNPGIIDSSLHFENAWCDRYFNTTGAINGHHTFRTLVALKTSAHPLVFTAKKYIFDHLVCDDLEITNNLNMAKGKTIGEVDLMEWYSSRLRLDSDQRIHSAVIFHGSGTAMKNLNVDKINDVSLHDLEHNTLRKDNNAHNFSNTVNANKIHVDGKILWKNHVSGHSLDELKHNALPLNSHELHTINSKWEFKSMSITGDLIVHGKTCGADVQYLNDDIVRKGENNVLISATKIFKESVNVNHINTQSLNGNVNFFRNLISLNDSNPKIDGHITFGKNLIVKKDLHLDEVNDISMKKLCDSYSFDNDNTHVIRRDVVAEELLGHNLTVLGLYQNKNISESLAKIVKTTGPLIKIYGDKVFTEPVHVRGNLSTGRVNDIDLVNLAKSLTMTNKPYAFSVPVHLKNVEADQCLVNNQMESKYLPHDYNLPYLSQHAIYINGHHQGNQDSYSGFHFEDVAIEKDFHADEINGIPTENYIRLNDQNQFIPNLVVENARFSGPNVFVRNHVGGLNLPKEYSNTLMDDSPAPQHIKGHTIFRNHLEVNGNFICENEEFPQSVTDVVTVDHNHTIYGPIIFQKPVHVRDMVVTQTISGYTMDQYLSEPLTYDGEQEIPASWRFNGGVTFEDDVVGKGNLDGYDLKNIIKEIKYNASLAEKVVENDLKAFHDLCSRLDSITKHLTQTSMKLNYFDAQQNIMLRKHVHKITSIQVQGNIILLMFVEDCRVLNYNWNHEEEFFYELQPTSLTEPKIGQVKSTQTFSWNGEGFLVFSTETSDCVTHPQGLYIISIDKTGKLSVPKLIINSFIVDFKIIEIRGNIFLFAITDKSNDVGQEVIVYSWHSLGKFIAEQYLYLNGPLLQLEITEFQRGIACLFQTRYAIFTYYYTIGSKAVSLLGFTEYLVKQNSSMLIFNSHGTLFMIVQERGAGKSVIQPSCSLQVFRIHEGKMQRLQSLPTGDVIALNLVPFSDNEILISVISNREPVKFYKFMGLSGLQPFYSNPVKIFDARQLDFFNVKPWMSKSPRPFFVILTKNVAKIYRSLVFGSKMEQSYESFKNICHIK